MLRAVVRDSWATLQMYAGMSSCDVTLFLFTIWVSLCLFLPTPDEVHDLRYFPNAIQNAISMPKLHFSTT